MLHLLLWCVAVWGDGGKCADVCSSYCYGVLQCGETEGNVVMCAAVTVMVCCSVGEREGNVVMCAAVTFMVCYSVGEREGNVVMCAAVTVMVCCIVGRLREMW